MSLLLLFVSYCPVFVAQDDSTERFAALKAEYDAAKNAWWEQLDKASDSDGVVRGEPEDPPRRSCPASAHSPMTNPESPQPFRLSPG